MCICMYVYIYICICVLFMYVYQPTYAFARLPCCHVSGAPRVETNAIETHDLRIMRLTRCQLRYFRKTCPRPDSKQ